MLAKLNSYLEYNLTRHCAIHPTVAEDIRSNCDTGNVQSVVDNVMKLSHRQLEILGI